MLLIFFLNILHHTKIVNFCYLRSLHNPNGGIVKPRKYSCDIVVAFNGMTSTEFYKIHTSQDLSQVIHPITTVL